MRWWPISRISVRRSRFDNNKVKTMDVNTLRELVTILFFAGFIGIAWWAYSPSRKSKLDEIGRSVLDDDTTKGS